MTLRWLHLSDFHTGKDGYGQRRLFREILKHVAEHAPPDFVFITGDIAQAGLAAQYDEFGVEFLLPLQETVGANCTILMVPGNHDVDRNQEKFVTREAIRQKSPQFFDPDADGLGERQAILSRFAAYREHCQLLDEADWLNSAAGCFIHQGEAVGILGLNTAWFAEDDHDERQLSPGKAIVETGLEKLVGIKIVLGHHPLDWFAPEDAKMLRALFGQHRVIYLHGHLHQNCSRFEEGAGQPFLTLQSGAAFQAREDDQWVNGLLWGELTEQGIALEPRLWNKDHQEWALDGMAFPETYRQADRWVLPLPGTATPKATGGQSKKTAAKPVKTFKAPSGWEIIDRDYLDKVDKNPDEAVILSYFDGRIPNWGLALCPQIPRRTVVGQLTERLVSAPGDGRPSINLLLGAGGEGKSTAFLQTIEAVLQADASWRALHRRGDNATLSRKLVEELPHDAGQHWLITSDDADLIAADVYALAFELQSKGRGDVHFLLCARFTDWRNTKISPPQWERLPGYHEQELRGLDDEDAARIVAAWSAYHDQGLGRLAGLSQEDAVAKLVAESRSEKSREDGAFLGALLRLRLGEELKGHVKKLLDRLNERKILPENPNTLLDAFAYIAAMHAENQLFLSKLVLAKALGVEVRELRSKVLWPLGEEAAADVAGELVFTRHRAIAEAAMDILTNTMFYEVEPDECYIDLVRTAQELKQKGNFIIALEKWRFLSDFFFNKGNHSLAIKLAQTLVQVVRTDSYVRVKLAQLFRKAGQPEQALRVFREAPQPDNHRAFFHEWATAEGNKGNHALDAWLDAVALADDTAQRPPSNKDAAMCLTGFGVACRELFAGYNKPVFITGCGAAGQLGLSLRGLDAKAKKYLSEHQQTAHSHGVSEVHPKTALKCIEEAAVAAWQQRESDLPEWIAPAEELTFHGLAELLRIEK